MEMSYFCESFSSLFALFLSKEAWMADVWNPEGEGGGWTPQFSRAFNDWEWECVKLLFAEDSNN